TLRSSYVEGERGAFANTLAVAYRERTFAALEAGADRDPAARPLAAGGIDRHVQHRRAHRALAVDAALLAVDAPVDVVEAVLERVQASVDGARVESGQGRDPGVGVAVGGGQGGRVARLHVAAQGVVAGVGVVARGVEGGQVARLHVGAQGGIAGIGVAA